mgnify:CR=1 FL=1
MTPKNLDNLIEEFNGYPTAEEKLEWIVTRKADAGVLPDAYCIESARIQGCLSQLWLRGSIESDSCLFQCRSDSNVVQGIMAFICDLYCGLTPEEVLTLGKVNIGIETMISINRRQSVAAVFNYIQMFAQKCGAANEAL